MTDDLIARLRGPLTFMDDCEEAADALESQAKRIAELEEKLADEEYVSKDTNEMFHEVRDENIELRARIAELEARAALIDEHLSQAIGNLKKRDARIEELEAALKPFADYSVAVDWEVFTPEMHFARSLKFPCDILYGDLRAARAALEKKNG